MTDELNRTRTSIIQAFNRLILAHGRAKPKVTDILDEAEVARSTFYEHFDGRDSLLLAALRGPLSVIADVAVGVGETSRAAATLDHFRENRRGAIELLKGPLHPRVVRTLAELIAERLPNSPKAAPLHLADMQIGFIRLWLTGETSYASTELAALMISSAQAQLSAFAAMRTE